MFSMKLNFMRHGAPLLATAFFFCGGCSTPPPPPSVATPPAPEVAAADKLFQAGDYEKATAACIEIARKDPLTPGLADLEARIQEKMAALRKANFEKKTDATDANATADALRHGVLPATYGLSHHVRGETSALRTPPTRMQQTLNQPISVHLENVSLNDIVAQIGASQNINIITDGNLGAGTLTIHAEKVPLSEILAYIGRNLNVTFCAGDNVIWVTKRATNDAGEPFETRIYRLRKGLAGGEIQPGSGSTMTTSFGGSSTARGGGSASNSGNSSGNSAKSVPDLIDTVKRFVPQPGGSDILFNTKAHALIVRNTRENLALTEDIVDALDVRPAQVLIEARFMDVSVSDLRELGVDWVLNSDLQLGGVGNNAATLIANPKNATVTTLQNPTALLTDNGDPTLANRGLNLTYQGVLGNAQFQAVLHALQQSGKAKTLTVPRVTALNNQTASIRIGDDFRFFENFTEQDTTRVIGINGTSTSVTESHVVPDGTPSLEELGYMLQVTPSVGADYSTINLKLVPQISSVKPESEWIAYTFGYSESYSTTNGDSAPTPEIVKLPVFTRQKIDTEVVIHSGETVALGGLAQTKRTKSTTGVPFFSSLPWIGQLFRHDVDIDNVDNLIIFVTATILADTGEQLVPITPSEPVGLPLPPGTR
jgi:type II secretory pathway component GspD/PulD (secretin)